MRNDLANSLKQFSVSDERKFQPEASAVLRPNGLRTLFRPFTDPTSVGIKIIVDPSTATPAPSELQLQPQKGAGDTKKATLHGIIALCHEDGMPKGFLNGEEVTGYRTSLSAMVPYTWRKRTAKIVVFGAGKQALWHIRLALVLRGEEIERITVVNRSSERCHQLLDQIKAENESIWKSTVELDSINPEESQLPAVLDEADVVFCTTPSKKPLFPAEYLSLRITEGRGCYISAIGSWQPEMVEIDPALLNEVAGSQRGYNPRGSPGGAVLVDDRETALASTGELVKSDVKSDQVVEVGEILDWKANLASDSQGLLNGWLQEGFVVYKSVGVSLTDLAISNSVLALAAKHKKGTIIDDF